MKYNIKLSVITICSLWIFSGPINAAELKQKSPEKAELVTSATAERESAVSSQRIFINPETGEIDTNPAPENVSESKAQMSAEKISAEPETTATRQADGSIRIDFNGKYMMPVYGHVKPDGTPVSSHLTHKSQGED